jgi:hypothetical protein
MTEYTWRSSESPTGDICLNMQILDSRPTISEGHFLHIPENATAPKIAVPICVVLLSLLFSLWFLPTQYINPANIDWVFTRSDHMTDGAGHAIQAMFFGEEPWRWPPGELASFGGPVGGSLILAAVSPVLAIPAKLMETIGLIGPFWQFIGIQAVLGICLTALAVYFLALALGASKIASGAAALLSLPLPNLFVLAIFNESLSWQFLAILPMILLLHDKNPSQRLWPWPTAMGLAVWCNTYFAPMVIPFFMTHLWVIRRRHKTRLVELVKESLVVVFVAVVLHYLGGGFSVPVHDVVGSIAVLDILSVNLADLFHLLYDRQGYVYRGLTVLVLLSAGGMLAFVKHTVYRTIAADVAGKDGGPRSKTIFIPTLLTAAALFVIALGPIIHFGTAWSFRLPVPESMLQAMSVFRAIGRFSWPLIYLLLGVAGLAIDGLVKAIPAVGEKRNFILMAFCLLLIVLQFTEFHSELARFKNVAGAEVAQALSPDPAIDAAISTSNEIEFVPAHEGDAPWRFLSYYAIKYHVPMYSNNWLGRYNKDEVVRVRNLTIMTAVECRWVMDRVYVLNRSYLPQIAHCNYQMSEVAAYPNWVVLKLKQARS